MKKTLPLLLLFVGGILLFLREGQIKRPEEPVSEGCLFCHARVTDPDPSHPIAAFGCASCHLGNGHSLDQERAHRGMVANPGDLRVAARTCGRSACHADLVPRVKNSVMATNRGILKTIQYHWLGMEAATTDVVNLLGPNPDQNLAIDHFRKMCGGCHLWKPRGDRPGEVGRRGGGCSDCHVLDGHTDKGKPDGAFDHPALTTRIPSENCVKCHNRSARIGLSYFGRYESARYGTPYEEGGPSTRRLSGNRYFLHLSADIHYTRAQMACIDCHTALGVMGDGKAHDSMKAQVDITCEDCHSPRFIPVGSPQHLGKRLIFLNKMIPDPPGGRVAVTEKGTPLYNVQERKGRILFFRKKDGRSFELDPSYGEKAHHRLPGHGRLACQSCHSAWIPQCYGCHLTYHSSERQRDWLTGEETPGRWREARSYIRFSKPALGVDHRSRVYPVTPCQVFASLFDGENRFQSADAFRIMTLSAFDPHTTSKTSRPCEDCHGDPKTIGLGEGIRFMVEGKPKFRPTYDAARSGLPVSFPLDAYVDLEGRPQAVSVRGGSRPLNREEVARILAVDLCLGCHDRYDDKIYKDFEASKRQFQNDPSIPCRK